MLDTAEASRWLCAPLAVLSASDGRSDTSECTSDVSEWADEEEGSLADDTGAVDRVTGLAGVGGGARGVVPFA